MHSNGPVGKMNKIEIFKEPYLVCPLSAEVINLLTLMLAAAIKCMQLKSITTYFFGMYCEAVQVMIG